MTDLRDTPTFAPWPPERVSLPGYTLSVRVAPGTGPAAEPAVFVHGLGGSALNWTQLMGLLADRLDGRAPDLPGFGDSPPPDDGDYSVAGHARAVIALLEHDDRGRVHLFGNSLGGAVATVVAAQRPDLVRTLTLIAPALPDLRPGRWRTAVAAMALPGVGALVARRMQELTPEERVAGLLDLVFADPANVSPAARQLAVEEATRRAALPYASDALASSARGLMRSWATRGPDSLWAQARRVGAPTLVVYGGKDKLVPHAGRRVTETFPDARVVLLLSSGHVAQMEHPEVVERLVREHLGRVG